MRPWKTTVWLGTLAAVALALWPDGAAAQSFSKRKLMGKFRAVGAKEVDLDTASGQVLRVISFPPKPEVSGLPPGDKFVTFKLSGEAEPDFLAKGHCLRFKAELKGRRVAQGEVGELTLFSPKPGELGISGGPAESNRPDPTAVASFEVAGEIVSIRERQLVLKVPTSKGKPQTLNVTLSKEPKIHVAIDGDLSLAQVGDPAEVDAYSMNQNGKDVPGVMYGGTVTVKLAKPLMSEKRAKALARSERLAPKTAAAVGEAKSGESKTAQTPPAARSKPAPSPKAPKTDVAANEPPAQKAKPDVPEPSEPVDPKPAELIVKDAFSVDK